MSPTSTLANSFAGNNLTSCYYHKNSSEGNANGFRAAVFQRRDLNLLAWTGDNAPNLTFKRTGCVNLPSLGEGTNLAASWLTERSGRMFFVHKFGHLFAWEYKLEDDKLKGENLMLVYASGDIIDPKSSLAAVSVGEPGNVTQYVFWQSSGGDLYYGSLSSDGDFKKELIRKCLSKGAIAATIIGDLPVVWVPRDSGDDLSSYVINDGAVPIQYDIPSSLVDPTYGKFTAHTAILNGQLQVGFVYQRDNVNPGAKKLVYLRRDEIRGEEWTKDEAFPGPQLPGDANIASFGAPSKDLVILYEANFDHHVYYKKSSDGGESWSEQFQLPEA